MAFACPPLSSICSSRMSGFRTSSYLESYRFHNASKISSYRNSSSFFNDSECLKILQRCFIFGSRSNIIKTQNVKVGIIQARRKTGFLELFENSKNNRKVVSKRPPLRPGKISPKRIVPPHILRPPYAETGVNPPWLEDYQIQDEEGIVGMRAAGKLAARVRDYAGTLVKPGVTTDEIDEAVHNMIIENDAYPSPLNYSGFPKSVCTSINECICHGIPDSRPLEDGDIVNIDVTVYLNGYHGDTSKTFFCGKVSKEAKKIVKVTEECLNAAIAICKPNVEIKKIGEIIQTIADKNNYGTVRNFVGHGVGKVFHSEPAILHFKNNSWGRLKLGQTFTIEPMLTLGDIDHVVWEDNWTAVTRDGSLSAQFEHSLLVVEDGVEILTL